MPRFDGLTRNVLQTLARRYDEIQFHLYRVTNRNRVVRAHKRSDVLRGAIIRCAENRIGFNS